MDKNYELEIIANNIRKLVLKQIYSAKSGHPGGSLSIADIMAVLYFDKMNVDPKNPRLENRDRFVLSKGHACPALYAALALKGYFDIEKLNTFRNVNSNLEGHPSMLKVEGVDISTGSLGQGLSVANGMALAGKFDNKDYTVYAILGDGEIEEGQIWEASMTAAHYKLDNICVFIDKNGLQIDGATNEVMSSNPIDKKFEAFGWNVCKIDGNNINQIRKAIDECKMVKGKPSVIICNTIKGKGISFMENNYIWHGKAPSDEEYAIAIKELGGEF